MFAYRFRKAVLSSSAAAAAALAKHEILEVSAPPRPVMRPTGIPSNILIPTFARGDKYTGFAWKV